MSQESTGFLRVGRLPEDALSDLGPLQRLIGTWVGNKGWNLIAVPFEKTFRLEIMPYTETIIFTPVGALVPNKDGSANFMRVPALQYELRIADTATNTPLHVENGMWLFLKVDDDSDPDNKQNHDQVARLSSIPHGDTVLALGQYSKNPGPPTIPPVNTLPDTGGAPPGYTDPYTDPTAPPIFHIDKLNPAATLQQVLDAMPRQSPPQRVSETVVLQVSAGTSSRIQPVVPDAAGAVTNIPYIVKNADAAAFTSIFWIETVEVEGGDPFLQLQYTQETDLLFLPRFDKDPSINGGKILWPHVNVNTLIKQ